MPQHVEQFSAFVAAILDELYDSFPVPIELSSSGFFQSADVAEMFAALDRRLETIPKDGSFARANVAAAEAEKITARVYEDQETRAVVRGTIEFLIAEGSFGVPKHIPKKVSTAAASSRAKASLTFMSNSRTRNSAPRAQRSSSG